MILLNELNLIVFYLHVDLFELSTGMISYVQFASFYTRSVERVCLQQLAISCLRPVLVKKRTDLVAVRIG